MGWNHQPVVVYFSKRGDFWISGRFVTGGGIARDPNHEVKTLDTGDLSTASSHSFPL